MNRPLGRVLIPPPPTGDDVKQYTALANTVREQARWNKRSSRYIQDKLNEFQGQLNSQVQGVGAVIASAATITVSAAMHHITGVAAIATINAPAGFSGPVFLFADGAFSVTTGGNILLARGPYTPGQLVILAYDPATAKWSPT
jgi:hypothetical protein